MALFGLFSPWLAWAAGALLAWLLATIGFNMEAQLEREGRRGGNRKASDWFARAATLPWHVLKGLGYAVLRALIMAAIATLGLAIATVALQYRSPWWIPRYSDSRFHCRLGLKDRFRKAVSYKPAVAPSVG